jgi:ligand-binding sensor domain-containing protein
LWASTNSSLVHWELSTDTYTRYLIQATDMAVAPDGTLWLATDHGVCHFDGTTCRTYTDADGLIHNAVWTVTVASDGVVWVGTERGVSRFDGRSWKSYPSNVPTRDLAVAASGEVWAATVEGVGRYMPSQDAWTTYTDEHGLPGLQAQVIAVGPEGNVWTYILWQGVYRFDGENWHTVDGITGGIVADIAFAADGTPWVATVGSTHYPGGNLAYRDGNKWNDVTSEHGLRPIGTIALGPTGEIAAATSLGLGVYQGGEWRLLKDGPTHDRVMSVAVTPDGAAWFGFGGHSTSSLGGLSRFDGQNWHYFLGDAGVNVLAVAPDGSLWASMGCEVQRYDGVAWETVTRCGEDLPVGNVSDIAFTPDGAAWIANGFALAHFDGQTWTVYHKLINSLEVAPDGAIWMNGLEGLQDSFYVARFDGKSWTTYKAAESFPGAFRVSAVTHEGLVWGIVPERGLAYFDPSAMLGAGSGSWSDGRSWTFYPTAGSVSLDSINALTVAPDGGLWVITNQGLAYFDGSGWEPVHLDHDPGTINAMAFAPDGSIWLGTSQGAIHFRPSETVPTRSMKGYELYSWQVQGEWYFALVIGTNRIKTYDEIASPEVRVQGLEALEGQLDQLPSGEQVFWPAQRVPNTGLPPHEMIDEIRTYCRQRGIHLVMEQTPLPDDAFGNLVQASSVL